MDSGVPSPWWRHAGDDRFGPVLALLVASLVVGAVLPSRLSALSVAALGILLWLAVARAAGLSVRARRTGLVWFVSVSLVAGGAAATHTFLSSGDVAWFADLGRRLLGPELASAKPWVPVFPVPDSGA